MKAKGIFYVFIYVSDLERSKAFYRDTLGWKLGTEEGNVAGLAFGAGYVVMHQDNRNPDARRYAGGMNVSVNVESADAEHARLSASGAKVTALSDWPWGERNFSITDPDGYSWIISQAIQTSR